MNSTSTVAPSASQPSIRVRSHANRTPALVRNVRDRDDLERVRRTPSRTPPAAPCRSAPGSATRCSLCGVEQRVGVEPAAPEQERPLVEQEVEVAGQVEQHRAATPASPPPAATPAGRRCGERDPPDVAPRAARHRSLHLGWPAHGREIYRRADLRIATWVLLQCLRCGGRSPVRAPLIMGQVAIVTGSGGLIGSESVRHLVARGLRRGRDRERHAQPLLRPRGLDLAGHRGARDGVPGVPLGRARHPRRRGGRAAVRRATPARSRSSSTPPPSRPTTGRRASRRPTSASTPTAP